MSESPSIDIDLDLLLDCRYGDINAVREFIHTHGVQQLANARDERANNVLHMCAANGHADILAYILSLPDLPPALLTAGNDAGNTPLHWACLNAQLPCAKLLVAFQPSSLPQSAESTLRLGPALILARNALGQTPLGEAERSGWDEGAKWLVGVMDLHLTSEASNTVEEEGDGDDGGEDDDDDSKITNGIQKVETQLEELRISNGNGSTDADVDSSPSP